jgi:hypothetical protein
MKRLIAILALFASPVLASLEDDLVAARSAALDLAGGFGNDGFKLRDGFWSGSLKAGQAKVVQVNLYAGNQYWFTLAAVGTAKKVAVSIYDESGKPVTMESHQDGARAAAGFSPTASGPYLVKLEIVDGEPSAAALVYSYK